MKTIVVIWILFSAPNAGDNAVENYSEFEEDFYSEMECKNVAKELNKKFTPMYFYCVERE